MTSASARATTRLNPETERMDHSFDYFVRHLASRRVSRLLVAFCCLAPAPDGGAEQQGGGPMAQVKVKIRKLEKIETTGQRDEYVG